MGHQAIIYGRIQEDWEGTGERWPVAPEYNRAVLESLPDEDQNWPFLTRHMFGAACRPFHGAADRGLYRGSIIHFGASLKDDSDDADWPDRFAAKLEELVLKRLLWTSARLHVETSFFPERVIAYRVEAESLNEMYRELSLSCFGERIVSEARWQRRDLSVTECGGDWLR
jgi:hypothetical protein